MVGNTRAGRRRQSGLSTARLTVEHLEERLVPTVYTWTGSGANANWSTAANWSGGAAPTGVSTDQLVFASTGSQHTNTNDLTGATFGKITLSGNDYTITGNSITLSPGTNSTAFDATNTSGTNVFNLAITVGSNGEKFQTASGGTLNLGGNIALNNSLVITGSGAVNASGVISGSGGITLPGSTSVTVSFSGSNTYSGTTTQDGGTLKLGSNSALGTGTLDIGSGNDPSIQADGSSRSFSNSLTISGDFKISGSNDLTFSGSVSLSGSPDAIINNTGLSIVSGAISGSSRVITKDGSGTLLLDSTSNSFRGANVDAGILGGVGTIGNSSGTLVVNSGGTVDPGSPNTATGILGSTSVNFHSGSTYQVQTNGTTAGSGYDQLDVTGSVTLGGTLTVSAVGFTPSSGSTFTIIKNDGTDAVSGTFVGLSEGALFSADGVTFQISYVGGSGNDVVLTASAPVVTAPSNQSTNEGTSTSFSLGSYTQSPTNGNWSVDVNWGDGSSHTTFTTSSTGSLGSQSHTYADGPHTYTVTVKVTDATGGYGINTFQVTVNNVAPTVTAASNQTASEGSSSTFSLGSFSDPGSSSDSPYSIDVNWGDGSSHTTFTATSTGTIASKTHTYADNGNYTVTTKVTDKDGAYSTATYQVTVSNVAPNYTARGDQEADVTAPTFFDLGSFTDPGTVDNPWQVTVNWGDGSSNTVFNLSSTGDIPFKSHTYATAGTYTVGVTVKDKDNATDSDSFQVTVLSTTACDNPSTWLWTGAAGGNWSDPGNWDLVSGPGHIWGYPDGPSDQVQVFIQPTGNSSINLDVPNIVIGGLSFDYQGDNNELSINGTYTLTFNSLCGPAEIHLIDITGSNAEKINVPLELDSPLCVHNDTANGVLEFNSPAIAGTEPFIMGDPGSTISGNGRVRLALGSPFYGPIFVNEGTLELSSVNSHDFVAGPLVDGDGLNTDIVKLLSSECIATSSDVRIYNSGVFNVNNKTETIGNLTTFGGSVINAGSLTVTGTTTSNPSAGSANVVSVAATTNPTEGGVIPGVFTITRTGDTSAAVTIDLAVSGTAAEDTEYDHLPGSVTIAAGQTSATLTVTAIGDVCDKTVEVALLPNDCQFELGTSDATLTIVDAPLTSTGQTLTSTSGQAFTGTVATFVDSYTDEPEPDFTAVIQWGDGTMTNGDIITTSPGHYEVDYSHVFIAPGTYTITTYIQDDCGATTTATSTITVAAPPVPPNAALQQTCACGNSSSAVEAAGLASGLAMSQASQGPVRYFDGTIVMNATDLSSSGFGVGWDQARTWSNATGYASRGVNGISTVDPHQMYLQQVSGSSNTIVAVTIATEARFFNLVSGVYQDSHFNQDDLTYNSGDDTFTMVDTTGNQMVFYGFGTGYANGIKGQLKQFIDPAGNTTDLTYDSFGRLTEAARSEVVGSDTITEAYFSIYVNGGVNAGLQESVALKRQVNSDPWTLVRQVDYSYYDGVESFGNVGDLKTAVVSDASGSIDTTYYRYYTASDSNGYVGGLRYVFNPDSFARLEEAVGDPFTATDAQVAPYADNYFEYDSSHRVTKEIVQGSGCSCTSGGGLGTYTFSYETSSNSDGYNSWKYKTTETLPDGNQNIVYANYTGEVMLADFHDVADDVTPQDWLTFTQYDSQGRAILSANPSAVSGYDDSYADLLHMVSGNYQYLNDDSGLITTASFYSSTTATDSTAGGVAGYQESSSIQRGELGTSVLQNTAEYFLVTGGGATIAPVASSTVYRNDDGTGAETTSFSYTFFTGTTRMQSMTTTLPVVSSGQNGPGTADVSDTVFDQDGRVIWTRDADGFLNYFSYDEATGALVKTITDVDTTQTSDFANLPSGWSTPSGGGLHLITTMEVDSLGRDTKITDPNGNVTYMTYDDPNHEMRTYTGWNSTTHMPTGPTYVTRYDRPGSYYETLTMSAAPDVDISGRPTGTEAISDLQTLSRTFISAGGQVTDSLAYFALTGLTYTTSRSLGTAGTNFYDTTYGYDDRGRQNAVTAPTGTINRTVYDGLGRVVSTWVGTDDTPGFSEEDWTPANNVSPANMVQVVGYVYDNGGVGDSNLTEITQMPGGGADDRVTDCFFDWRDRQVACKYGMQGTEDSTTHRPIYFTMFDNLNEAVEQDMYDGDGVTITDGDSDAVPDAPDASLLRAKSTSEYDDQGRVFRTHVFSVNPTDGTVSTDSLTTNVFFDHRGNTIEVSSPGGLVQKMVYDGAGRQSVTYTTDGASGTDWAAANTVSGDIVLSQQEMQYDADGNTILTVDRERFHDETATGALGDVTTGPLARVYYAAYYYDAANRLTDSVNVGTNGGTSYTRPGTVPTRSDTVLVNSQTYNAAGWVEDVIDPRGITTRTLYDNLGRTADTIVDYTDGVPTADSNQTTAYTYDGDNNVLTVTAVLPGSAVQTTQYVYGVTTSSGSAVNSNDILAAMQYPGKTTGLPSSSEQETYTYNALGQITSATDRNGNVHEFTYDVLGRQTSDAVTTLGAGVDGSVRRIEIAYDTQGIAFLFTSYDAASGGSIVNQVERIFNGLGQMTAEYQSHSGAVVLATTPKVEYAYNEMAGGTNNSRLVSLTYPNGREIDYNYDSGLDDTISRLSSMSDSSGTLEAYKYLGLGTVVERDHPETDVNQTFLTGGTGDAGDQYAGLDRFGRVAEMAWINAVTSAYTDRLQYGYDRDSNVLTRDNLLNSDFSETYTYDDLNRLASFARSNGHTQDFTMDANGNFTNVTTDSSSEDRTSNSQNQLTGVSGQTSPTYDANGNMTTDEVGQQYVYDAWNRLVLVKDSSSNPLESFGFDAMGRRIIEDDGSALDLYFDSSNIIEEQVAGATTIQYVWEPHSINTLVLRDRDTDANGSLDERLYAQQDANNDVIAYVATSGDVAERNVFDPYGITTFVDASWNTLSSSAINSTYLFQDGRYDVAFVGYRFGAREYRPSIQVWISKDPIDQYTLATNGYFALNNNPLIYVDCFGFVAAPTLTTANREYAGKTITQGLFVWAGPGDFAYNHIAIGWVTRNCNQTQFSKGSYDLWYGKETPVIDKSNPLAINLTKHHGAYAGNWKGRKPTSPATVTFNAPWPSLPLKGDVEKYLGEEYQMRGTCGELTIEFTFGKGTGKLTAAIPGDVEKKLYGPTEEGVKSIVKPGEKEALSMMPNRVRTLLRGVAWTATKPMDWKVEKSIKLVFTWSWCPANAAKPTAAYAFTDDTGGVTKGAVK